MKNLLFLIPFLSIQCLLFAQETKPALFLNGDTQNSWERDPPYTLLFYTGSSVGVTLGYSSADEKKADEVYIHFRSKNPKAYLRDIRYV